MNVIKIHLWAKILGYLEENELTITICIQRLCCEHRIMIGQEANENTGAISNIPVCW